MISNVCAYDSSFWNYLNQYLSYAMDSRGTKIMRCDHKLVITVFLAPIPSCHPGFFAGKSLVNSLDWFSHVESGK